MRDRFSEMRRLRKVERRGRVPLWPITSVLGIGIASYLWAQVDSGALRAILLYVAAVSTLSYGLFSLLNIWGFADELGFRVSKVRWSIYYKNPQKGARDFRFAGVFVCIGALGMLSLAL